MPQETYVLRCYSCSMYQVHIVKKVNKWQCKICNEKQSVLNVYFKGSGSECRKQVQDLNASLTDEDEEQSFKSTFIEAYGLDCTLDENHQADPCHCPKRPKIDDGKWSKCLHDDDDTDIDTLSEIENFSSQRNTPSQNPSVSLSDSKELLNFLTAGSSGNLSTQLIDISSKICDSPKILASPTFSFSKSISPSPKIFTSLDNWDKYIFDNKEEGGDSGKNINYSQENSSTNDSTPLFQPTEINIFEDYNDDLDHTIDF